MSTYLNNSVNMCCCPTGIDQSIRVEKNVMLVDAETGELVHAQRGSVIEAGKTYKAVWVWALRISYTDAACYGSEEAVNAAYTAAVEAVKRGDPVSGLPTDGML